MLLRPAPRAAADLRRALGKAAAQIEKGSPWKDGYAESFNAGLRDELLEGEAFHTAREARIPVESRRRHRNTMRSHSALGDRPPAPKVLPAPQAARPRSAAGSAIRPRRNRPPHGACQNVIFRIRTEDDKGCRIVSASRIALGFASRRQAPAAPACHCCGAALEETSTDLDMTPFANSFVAPERAVAMEPFHPLRAVVCSGRRPVKLADFESSEAVVSDRPYFPSFSEAWPANVPAHAERTTETLGLGPRTPVVEVASNDGHLPRYSARRGIPAPATGRRRATDAVRAGQAPGPRSTWTP